MFKIYLSTNSFNPFGECRSSILENKKLSVIGIIGVKFKLDISSSILFTNPCISVWAFLKDLQGM